MEAGRPRGPEADFGRVRFGSEMTSDGFASERGRRQLESVRRRRLIAAGGTDPMLLLLGSDEARFLTRGVHVAGDGQML